MEKFRIIENRYIDIEWMALPDFPEPPDEQESPTEASQNQWQAYRKAIRKFSIIQKKNTFSKCFRIAKRNIGVLYYNEHLKRYSYSPCKDLYGEPVIDFRGEIRSHRDYGKELSDSDRKLFYNVNTPLNNLIR